MCEVDNLVISINRIISAKDSTRCGDSINYQFGRLYTCSINGAQCDNCKVIDFQSKINEIKSIIDNID
jgi:hypothetical protein